jgi:hypothetical protein
MLGRRPVRALTGTAFGFLFGLAGGLAGCWLWPRLDFPWALTLLAMLAGKVGFTLLLRRFRIWLTGHALAAYAAVGIFVAWAAATTLLLALSVTGEASATTATVVAAFMGLCCGVQHGFGDLLE